MRYPFDYIDKRKKTGDFFQEHRGTDYGMVRGTPLYAMYSGTVQIGTVSNGEVFIKCDKDEPILPEFVLVKTICINVKKYGFFHCSEILVKNGQHVNEGELIAKSGNVGKGSAYHAHVHMENSSDDVIDPEWVIGTRLMWDNIDSLNIEVSSLKKQLTQASNTEDVNTLQKEIKILNEKLLEADKNALEYQGTIKDTLEELATAEQGIRDLAKNNAVMKEEFDAFRIANNNQSVKIENQAKEITSLKAKIEKINNDEIIFNFDNFVKWLKKLKK